MKLWDNMRRRWNQPIFKVLRWYSTTSTLVLVGITMLDKACYLVEGPSPHPLDLFIRIVNAAIVIAVMYWYINLLVCKLLPAIKDEWRGTDT